MPRELVLIPPDPGFLSGTTPIGPGYPRTYTPAEMRSWAGDLDTLYRVHEEDGRLPVEQRRMTLWNATPPDQLPPRAKELLELDRTLFDPGSGDRIKGDLMPDGRVELESGRHRAHYIAERGDEPVPVWVAHPDQRELDAFAERCHEQVDRQRPQLLNPDRPDLLSELRIRHERVEPRLERGVFRGERG